MKGSLFLAVLVGAGCLPTAHNSDLPPECRRDSDCPVSGQTCDDDVCWGAPPPGPYAALLGPPAPRGDLVVTEVPTFDIPFDGTFSDLVIQAPVHLSGRVHLTCQTPTNAKCDASAALSAHLDVHGDAHIPGGPAFVDSATSDPSTRTGDSFTLSVPRLPADEHYTVVVTPDDLSPAVTADLNPAALAPPRTIELSAATDQANLDIPVGEGALRAVAGRVTDATGNGVRNVKVQAQGRFSPTDPLARVSTVAVTDAGGYYTLYVAEDALPIVDVVGTPQDAPYAGYTLRLRDTSAEKSAQSVPDLQLPAAGNPIAVTVPVFGHTGAGEAVPVVGARVEVSVELADAQHPNQVSTFAANGTTTDKGGAKLSLLPGNKDSLRTYAIGIVPPPMSEFASVHQTIQVGTSGGLLGVVDLGHRIGISGTLIDAAGNPAADVTVTAQLALRLSVKLPDDAKAELAQQPPTATTGSDGGFVVWVDPIVWVANQPLDGGAQYDLLCVPTDGARLPRWTFHDIDVGLVDALQPTIDQGALQLPPVRHVRGRVIDEKSHAVEGAEVRLLQPVTDPVLCMDQGLPQGCPLPAVLRAVDHSDEHGEVRLVLPAPP